jgi:peptide/nickel transport system substrate-binding protein
MPDIRIDLARQWLELRQDGALLLAAPVSTAAAGLGERFGSFQTPRGRHVVRARIGAGAPVGAVFVGRPPELLAYLAGRPGVQLSRAPGSSYHYLGFNLADPVTGDLRVRQAVAHAIDREAIVSHLLAGAARLAGSVLPPGHYAAARLPDHPHDPALARRLLAQAGHKHPRLTYKTSTDPVRLRIATAIQAQLAAVGIRVRVQSNEWGSFFGDIRAGRFQLYSLAWVGITQPDVLRQLFHSASLPPAGANRGRFVSPPVDALLDAAAQAHGAGQVDLYRQAQLAIHAQLPYVPLWYEDNVAVARAGLRGYALRPDGAWDALEFTDPPDARHPH